MKKFSIEQLIDRRWERRGTVVAATRQEAVSRYFTGASSGSLLGRGDIRVRRIWPVA